MSSEDDTCSKCQKKGCFGHVCRSVEVVYESDVSSDKIDEAFLGTIGKSCWNPVHNFVYSFDSQYLVILYYDFNNNNSINNNDYN